jgi:hypothetical protein
MKKKLVLFVIAVLSLGAGSLYYPVKSKASTTARYFIGDNCIDGNRNYCVDDVVVVSCPGCPSPGL